MSQSNLFAAVLPVFLAVSCSSPQSEREVREPLACVPGESQSCTTTSACQGAQVCADDGMSFGPCQCDKRGSGGVEQQPKGVGGRPPDVSSSGGGVGASFASGGEADISGGRSSGGASGGVTSRGGSATGGASASRGGEPGRGGNAGSSGEAGDGGGEPSGVGGDSEGGAGPVLASGGQSSQGVCLPLGMTDYPYPAYVAARYLPGSCTDDQAGSYFDDCVMRGTCSAYEADGGLSKCGACLQATPLDAEAYGPLLALGENGVLETNVAGCVELLGEGTCAPNLQIAALCESLACQSGCANAEAETACMMSARTGSCSLLHKQASCITTMQNVTACSGTDFRSQFLAVARVFCQ